MRHFSIVALLCLPLAAFAQSKDNLPWAIKPSFQYCQDFSEGVAVCNLAPDTLLGMYETVAIDTTGKELFKIAPNKQLGNFSEGLAALYEGEGSVQFVDRTGKLVIARYFDSGWEFRNGLAAVTRDSETGYINRKGEFVYIADRYQYLGNFYEERAQVAVPAPKKKGKKWEMDYIPYLYGFIDMRCEEVVPCKYDFVSDFSEGRAMVNTKNKAGYVDKNGNVSVPLKYIYAEPFSEGLASVAIVKKGSKRGKYDYELSYGFIDTMGNTVIPHQFQSASSFREGLCAVSNSEGKWGFIDRTGKMVVNFQYSSAYDFSEGLAQVYNDEKWGFIDKTGKLVIPFILDSAGPFKNGRARASLNYEAGCGFLYNPLKKL